MVTLRKSAAPLGPAADLRDLASKRRLAGRRKQLRALAEALDTKTGITEWAGIDLFAAFPAESTVAEPTTRWVRRSLDIATQLLFFSPIFFTWFGLLQAARTYRKFIHIKKIASESFLQGWETGFDHHLSRAWYLDRVAQGVVVLIAILAIAMLLQFLYRSVADEDAADRLNRRLAQVLTDADLQLVPYRLTAPSQAAAELQKAAAEFHKTAAAIKDVGETAGKTQAAAAGSMIAATAALTKVDVLATAATTAAGQVDKASVALDKRLADMTTSTTAMVTAEKDLAQRIGAASTKLAGTLDGLVKRLGEAIKQSQQDLVAASNGSSAKIATALEGGASQIRTALAEVTVAGTAYAHRVEQAADIIGQAGDSVNIMPGMISGFQVSVADLAGKIADLERAVTQAKAVLPTPADIPPGLPQTSGELRQAVSGLQSAIGDLKTAAAALQGAAASMRQRPQPPAPRRRPARPPADPVSSSNSAPSAPPRSPVASPAGGAGDPRPAGQEPVPQVAPSLTQVHELSATPVAGGPADPVGSTPEPAEQLNGAPVEPMVDSDAEEPWWQASPDGEPADRDGQRRFRRWLPFGRARR